MASTPTIESLQRILQTKCYYYAYIDDNGVRGPIDMSEFKEGEPETNYYYDEDGINLPYDNVKFSVENKLEIHRLRFNQPKILPKSTQLPTLKLYNETRLFVKGKGMRMLYLLKDKGVIGNSDKEVVGSIKSNWEKPKKYNDEQDEYQVYINNVDIESDEQGKRLCKLMVQLFLLSANDSAGQNLSFHLTNAGGKISCRCYTNAFKECGYKVYAYVDDQYINEDGDEDDTREVRKEGTLEYCEELYPDPDDTGEHTTMGFIYSGVGGGKRSDSKRKKTKRHKKQKRNKTKKSRKQNHNKTKRSRKDR